MKSIEEFIGCKEKFNGTFKLYTTDNILSFLVCSKNDKLKDIDVSTIMKYGSVRLRVKIKSEIIIVGIRNKKEGLFTCKKYPNSIFIFPISLLKKKLYDK